MAVGWSWWGVFGRESSPGQLVQKDPQQVPGPEGLSGLGGAGLGRGAVSPRCQDGGAVPEPEPREGTGARRGGVARRGSQASWALLDDSPVPDNPAAGASPRS